MRSVLNSFTIPQLIITPVGGIISFKPLAVFVKVRTRVELAREYFVVHNPRNLLSKASDYSDICVEGFEETLRVLRNS